MSFLIFYITFFSLYERRQKMNLDFLEKISSEQRKRIAINFIRRKKGNVLKKDQKYFDPYTYSSA